MAAPRVQDVLDFLTERGFAGAASALRDDLLSRGGPSASHGLDDGLDGSRPPLPPVRTAPAPFPRDGDDGRGAGSSSTSSDAFVSMGSSPSELLNPYGLWSPSRAKSDDPSEFGTAREYNDVNVFSDTCWYDDQYPGYVNDPYPGYLNDPYLVPANSGDCRSEDKFVMSIEAEERFGQQDHKNPDVGELYSAIGVKPKHGERYGSSFSCSVPLCDCCKGGESELAGSSNSSVYGRYRIMPDQTERLDECGVFGNQLKRMDKNPEGFPREDDHPTCKQKSSGSSDCHVKAHFVTKSDREEFQKEECNMQLVTEKASDSGDGHERGVPRAVDKESLDRRAVVFEGEGHGTADELQLYTPHEDDYEIFNLRVIHRKNRTGFEENKDLPIILNSVIAGRYYVTEYLGSAAFSKVVQAHDLHTGIDVCLKIIKNDKDFFDQSLDEIKLLKFVNKYDPADVRHILRLFDYFYYQEHLFIVCELLRANLYEFQKYNQDSGGEVYFTLPRIQAIARQCLEALDYLHHLRIIHCDLKPENILIKSYSRCEIKVIDLGSSCFQTDNLCIYVQSRSYRAPEVILGLPYDQKIDVWSLGCVLAELYTGDVLFPNESVIMMLARMIGILGPIDMEMLEMGQETHKYFTDGYDLYQKIEETGQVEYLIPEKSSLPQHLEVYDIAFVDFLSCLLRTNPKRRLTASQALQHPWLSFSYQ